MPRRMEPEEARAFLMEGTRTGRLATVRRDGRPHVMPVWFVLDGDDLVFTTHSATVKGRNLRRDGRVAVCVDDDRPPYAFVMVEGRATLSEDLDELRRWATAIGGRYMGADRAQEFGARNGVPGELLVRVRIEKLLGEADVAGYGSR
jgi:PPOX class probable F420-dependent enzyme